MPRPLVCHFEMVLQITAVYSFPDSGSRFSVPRSPFPVPRSPFPVLSCTYEVEIKENAYLNKTPVPEHWVLVWMFFGKYSRHALLRRIFPRSHSWYRDLPLDAERRDETTESATKCRGNGTRSARTWWTRSLKSRKLRKQKFTWTEFRRTPNRFQGNANQNKKGSKLRSGKIWLPKRANVPSFTLFDVTTIQRTIKSAKISPCDGLAYIPSHTHSAWLLVENNLNLFKVVKYCTFFIESIRLLFSCEFFFSTRDQLYLVMRASNKSLKYTYRNEISRTCDARKAPQMRDYRLTCTRLIFVHYLVDSETRPSSFPKTYYLIARVCFSLSCTLVMS